MDAHDIFRKLSYGTNYGKQHFIGNHKITSKLDCTARETTKHIQVSSSDNIIIKQEREDDDDFTLLSGTTEDNLTKANKKGNNKKITKCNDQEQENVNRIRKLNRISISGRNIPKPIETFEQLTSEYNVMPQLVNNLISCGFTSPTPIQMQAIPVMLNNRQILACAPTGSGKTAAFLVPVIQYLKNPRNNGFRALIICPTRELARQIFRECNLLIDGTGLRSYLISKLSQKHNKLGANFTKKFDILITTPNRLIYMMKQENPIDLTSVEWLIVDESDKLFEVGVRGFRDQLADIYKVCDSNKLKRAMFSATHTHHVAKWCKRKMKGLVSVTVGHRNTAVDLVEQKLLFVGNEHGKHIAFSNLVHEGLHPPVLVFVQSKERAKELFTELIYDGINVDVIHADRTQLQRDNVVKAFREGKIWVLICTELMGRGIDFKGINLVINYDFPQSAISYIHRIGRTGRAGRPGKAITFFTNDDKPTLRSIATVMKESGCVVPNYMLSIQKTSKKIKQKLEHSVPKRETISTSILWNNKKRKSKIVKQNNKSLKIKE